MKYWDSRSSIPDFDGGLIWFDVHSQTYYFEEKPMQCNAEKTRQCNFKECNAKKRNHKPS